MLRNKFCLEQPSVVQLSGESRYLTPLWVSESCQSTTTCFEELLSASVFSSSYNQEITSYKIRDGLKMLSLREQHVLVQFWSPHVVGKHQRLTTTDQPFGLGVLSEELCFYRRDSERKAFIVDRDHEEDDVSPPARVFRRGLPEWTCDVTNYNTKDFPQKDTAIRCNLHGYLALPVFDSTTTGLCVGVLELLTSSQLKDVVYEVEQVHHMLKTVDLTSPKAFELFVGPALTVSNERNSNNESDKIVGVLKCVCDTHRLPLAQTWVLSPSTSYFAHGEVIDKSCSSFNTKCFNKVCISTASPYYVRHMSAWKFMEASKKCHLEKARGVVGRALSSCGSCFCVDVTKLDEEVYLLAHNARISGLTSCFAIFLHSVEGNNDYVLEFFLPLDIKDSRHVMKLVQTLKQSIEAASGFELGEGSFIEVVGPPMELSVMGSSDLELVVADTSETNYANIVADQWSSTNASMESICDNFSEYC